MKVKLSELLLSLESGGRPKGGANKDETGIPSVGAEHLNDNGGFNFKSIKYIPLEYFKSLKSGMIEQDNILIVKDGATTGKVSFVSYDFPYKTCSVNEHVFLLKINTNKAIPNYVFQYLRTKQGLKEILNDFRGATVGGISRRFVELVQVQLPTLSDQRKIANMLTKAENLIAQRKETISLLDEFLKSTFIEKFIDKKYPLARLENLCTKITDGEHLKPIYSENGFPFISVVNISQGFLNFENCKFISGNDFEKFTKRCKPELNDILYTKVGATYGRAVFVDTERPFSLYVSVALIKPSKEKVNSKFLQFVINHPYVKRQADKSIKGAGVPDLHLIEIKSFKIPVPPRAMQDDFAFTVQQTEFLKDQYQKSLMELENLYGSLSQRAFSGELNIKD